MISVGVVVTCHNLGRFLRDALGSVVAQTRRPDAVLIVDDGSTDLFTRQVLLAIERDGFEVVRAPHGGPGAARNHGARLLDTDCLIFLDADDRLAPWYVERTTDMLLRGGFDMVSTGLVEIGRHELWLPPTTTAGVFEGGAAMHISTLIRRYVWERTGGFDEQLAGSEDTVFWVSALELGFRCGLIPEAGLEMRVRPGSRSELALARDTHLAMIASIVDRWPRLGDVAVTWTERCLRDQEEYARQLDDQGRDAERQVQALRTEIQTLRSALTTAGNRPVDWGALDLAPVSDCWGYDRGQPVDRYYIEQFLHRHRADVHGRVLEVHDREYTLRFGTDVTQSDVIDIDASNADATIVGDLTRPDSLPPNSYDCVILTQVLSAVSDPGAALRTVARALRPGGVLLCTVSSVNRVAPGKEGDGPDYWRFTEASLRHALAGAFPLDAFEIQAFGNVQACAALLYGLAAHEIGPERLDRHDPGVPLIIAARAVKPPATVTVSEPAAPAAVLCYHRLRALGPDPHGIAMSPDVFESHLDALQSAFDIVPLDEVLQPPRGPRPRVALTFDDGYPDHVEIAAASLARRGLPATFFVTTAPLSGPKEFWWDTLADIFLGDVPLPPALRLSVRGHRRVFDTASARGRREAHDWIVGMIGAASADERDRIVETLAGWSGRPAPARELYSPLDLRRLRCLASVSGMRIGAHTVHHLNLPAQSLATQALEMHRCRRALEEALGCGVVDLAYPYGAADDATERLAREIGFTRAWVVEDRAVSPGDSLWRLPRLEVRNEPAAQLLARLHAVMSR